MSSDDRDTQEEYRAMTESVRDYRNDAATRPRMPRIDGFLQNQGRSKEGFPLTDVRWNITPPKP